MSFLGSIGNVVKSVFGGGGDKGYAADPSAYQEPIRQGLFNRAGAKKKADGTYDFGQVGSPLEGASGVKRANEGYDYSPINKAIAGYSKPPTLTESYNASVYNPYQFNFQGLPEEYAQNQIGLGSKDIQRQGQGDLAAIQEAVGIRRPGLLLKAGQQNQRNVAENLANLNAQIRGNVLNKNVDLAVEQQRQQAAENMNAAGFNAGEQYKGYQSKSDLEKSNADLVQRYLAALQGAGESKIGLQSNNLANERAYQDQALQLLMQMFGTSAGAANASAGNANTIRGQTLGFLSNLAGSAARGGG